MEIQQAAGWLNFNDDCFFEKINPKSSNKKNLGIL